MPDLTEDDVRRIVRDELAAAERRRCQQGRHDWVESSGVKHCLVCGVHEIAWPERRTAWSQPQGGH